MAKRRAFNNPIIPQPPVELLATPEQVAKILRRRLKDICALQPRAVKIISIDGTPYMPVRECRDALAARDGDV